MAYGYNNYDGKYTYHRYFTSLRGVDFSADPSEVSRFHFTLLENMWCDPATLDGVATETFPGYRVFGRFGAPILGIYRHRVGSEDYLVVHAGTALFRFPERLRDYEHTLSAISPLAVTVSAVRGCAFSYGESLCLLINGKYLMIDREGSVLSTEDEPDLAYVPTTYYNGTPYEQRNLLSDRVRLSFTADGPYAVVTGEEGMLFSVYNEEERTCSVRISERHLGAGKIEVPAAVMIGGEKYAVKALAPRAFAGMAGLVSVSLPASVTVIGARAFYGCSALRSITLPSKVTSIGKEAFYGCLSLFGIFLGGAALHSIGEGAFGYCLKLSEVRYGGTEAEYAAIIMEGADTLRDRTLTVHYGSDTPYENAAVLYRYPLYETCVSIEKVALGEDVLDENFLTVSGFLARYQSLSDGDHITHIELTAEDESLLKGKLLTVTATVSPTRFSLPHGSAPFGVAGKAALCGCTAVGKYDGRVFFTGNEDFPNTVFYSAPDETGINNPFYIGCLNYFNDGTGAVPNRGFLVSGGLLAVLKADAGGEGEIFFHSAADTETDLLPRIYPTVATTPGVGLSGCAGLYADDAVFLSKAGLYALERCATDGERVLSPRSTAVSVRLCEENTEEAQMAVFEGLLYLLTEGRIYLADSRKRTVHSGGASEYEWYYLSGIGSYAGDRPMYRYTSYLPAGAADYNISVHPDVAETAKGEIYSVTLKSGEQLYYAENEDGRFAVDTEGERTGGVFFPAKHLCATDEALYFGTDEGAVGCFNTDKRGEALFCPVKSYLYILDENGKYIPLNGKFGKLFSESMIESRKTFLFAGDGIYSYLGERPVFKDGDMATLVKPLGEYEGRRRIHRYYYTYAGHAYTAYCALAVDDGDIPHYAKDTVPRSAVVKLKTPEGSRLSVFVRTDRHPFTLLEEVRATTADAGDSDFSAFDFHTDAFASFPLREKERGWCYKQYLFEGGGFRSPFGIFSLSYSFRPSGRIKP